MQSLFTDNIILCVSPEAANCHCRHCFPLNQAMLEALFFHFVFCTCDSQLRLVFETASFQRVITGIGIIHHMGLRKKGDLYSLQTQEGDWLKRGSDVFEGKGSMPECILYISNKLKQKIKETKKRTSAKRFYHQKTIKISER